MIRLHSTLSCLSLGCLTLFVAFTASPSNAAETMPPQVASQLGLEQAWYRQMSVPAGAQSIVHQQIYVHVENPREFVEVVGSAGSTTKGGSTTKAAGSTMKADGSTTKAAGSTMKADGSTTKAAGSTMKAAGSTTKAAGSTMKSGGQMMGETIFARIPTDRVGRNGLEIGKDEAERLARNEIRRLKYRGFNAKITSRKVPRIRLYTLGDDGTVDCRDAESGEPVWIARVGDRRLGYGHLGINNQFVSVINGGNLIKLDAANGQEIEALRTTSMPLFGAVHAGRYSLLATIRSGVEAYPLFETTDPPFMEIVEGIALAPPAKSPSSSQVAWGTDKGFVYVMEAAGTPSVTFRLNTDGIVKGRIAPATDNRFFFGSSNGQAYGLWATRTGRVMWSKPYGEPFYNAPLVIDDQVLMRSTYGNLYSLDAKNGIMTWNDTIPNVDELIGAFDGKLFVRLLSGGMSVIDLEAGKTIKTMNEIQPRRLLVNSQTNRLYLVGKTGSVQCLRPIDATLPEFNASNKRTATDEPIGAEKMMMKEPVGSAPTETAPVADPFANGGGGDPFAGGGAASDPFAAGGGDPFGAGGGGDAMADDPFAAGADTGGANADPFADPFGN